MTIQDPKSMITSLFFITSASSVSIIRKTQARHTLITPVLTPESSRRPDQVIMPSFTTTGMGKVIKYLPHRTSPSSLAVKKTWILKRRTVDYLILLTSPSSNHSRRRRKVHTSARDPNPPRRKTNTNQRTSSPSSGQRP